jgi:succinate-semialdehyde dehydrogenase/glutarate-semialdehyde dehydrogenase
MKMVKSAVADGASSLCHGGPVPTLGPHFMSPVILKNVTMDMQIAKEECFGPVLSLLSFETEVEVISKANATHAGLAAYSFTKDLGRAWRLSEQLEAGMVGINASLLSTVQAPFGGIKESGLGREGSIVGLVRRIIRYSFMTIYIRTRSEVYYH